MDSQAIIEKYLQHHAEPEAQSVEKMGFHFQHTVIIPAYNEGESLIENLASIKEKNVLVILVINAEINSPTSVLDTNKKLLNAIRKSYFEIWRSKHGQGISLHQLENCSLLLIDRSSGQLKFPEGKGVGLARKIAADVALSLIHSKHIQSQWIHSTDADVTLPIEYFSRTTSVTSKAVAAVYPYTHVPVSDCNKHEKAVFLYEISLRHYVIGLKHAGSPYAFHTIGSTIAMRSDAYAAVRGFPKREAGEDFYMLNKLAKLGAIKHLDGDPILISGRRSNRVPFGTGQSVNNIEQLSSPLDQYQFYHPKIFSLLQFWLKELKQLSSISNLQKFEQHIRQNAQSPQLISGLEKLGAFQAIKNIIKQMGKQTSPLQQINTWFDGFRTLKLVHHLRDNGFPSLTLSELFDHEPYKQHQYGSVDNVNVLRNHFMSLEKEL